MRRFIAERTHCKASECGKTRRVELMAQVVKLPVGFKHILFIRLHHCGVCRHQDRPHIGNALTKAEHDEDMALIKEIGANTLRLAHYQHDDYFYDLCDRAGLVVWAEIPYISRHMSGGNENAKSQMKELVLQQYNHPSI